MAWQRKIPFGYMIRGGVVQPHPQEADAVRFIFGQYRAGASLLAIAEGMTRQGVRYHQHTADWNKNMVRWEIELLSLRCRWNPEKRAGQPVHRTAPLQEQKRSCRRIFLKGYEQAHWCK